MKSRRGSEKSAARNAHLTSGIDPIDRRPHYVAEYPGFQVLTSLVLPSSTASPQGDYQWYTPCCHIFGQFGTCIPLVPPGIELPSRGSRCRDLFAAWFLGRFTVPRTPSCSGRMDCRMLSDWNISSTIECRWWVLATPSVVEQTKELPAPQRLPALSRKGRSRSWWCGSAQSPRGGSKWPKAV